MGKMKEVYMQIMQANAESIPEDLTIRDMVRMHELQMYNWEEYEREQEKSRLFRVKQENPREITKAAEVKDYWQEELRQGQNRSTTKN